VGVRISGPLEGMWALEISFLSVSRMLFFLFRYSQAV
jgi:hypothetical protein